MKRIKQMLIIGALLALILVARTAGVSAQGGDELKPDITAPGATNGWYTGDVQVTWPIPQGATVVKGCEETVIDFDTKGVELSCEVETKEGSLSGSVVIKRDATPPTLLIDPAGLYFEVNEGDTLLLDAASSTDETSGIATITWDLLELDGAIAVNGNPVDSQNMDDNHFKNPVDILVVDGPGKAEFSAQVTDLAGNNASVVVIAILANVAPEISEVILSPETIPVGANVLATAVFTDPSILDTHTAAIDWGDGAVDKGVVVEQGGSGIVTGAHAFTEVSGLGYPIVVTVTDKDNGSGTASANVSVYADPPVEIYLPVISRN